MSSITNLNNNASVVNVGRTTPVSPGRTTANRSIPVVLASDQSPVPVEEQNKIQSEVALSLLGIPRSEVALGIFADVNTYDVNPSEWSLSPSTWILGNGIRHLPNEAGALIEAPRDKTSVLTSKRFFRYQPGRVSAATFGVKSSVSPIGAENDKTYTYDFAKNPVNRKFGIFDNFDGYYWENRQTGQGDNFSVVRRTQSLLKGPVTPFGDSEEFVRGLNPTSKIKVTQKDDYRISGKAPDSSTNVSPNLYPRARRIILENKFSMIENASANVVSSNSTYYSDLATEVGGSATAENIESRCKRDAGLWIDFIIKDLEWGGNAHTILNLTNFQNAILPDTDTYEVPFYQALKSEIVALSLVDDDRAEELIDIVISAFDTSDSSYSVPPSDTQIDAINYGSKSKFESIIDAKKYYWSYLVSTFNIDGTAASYDTASGQYTVDELKNKCQRDMIFIIDGYKNDIIGGGNAETKYNMSMYFKNDGMSIFTQTNANTDNAEPIRHTYLQALIASDLTGNNDVLVANTFGVYEAGDGFGYSTTDSEYSKMLSLSNLVISNFNDENTNAIESGTRGYAGNLVVYRDGMPMIHAAAYDPSLLIDQKDIPSKLRSNKNEITLSEGTVTLGQTVQYTGTLTYGDLVPQTYYKVSSVIGQKGDTFKLTKLYDADGNNSVIGTPVSFSNTDLTSVSSNTVTENASGDVVLSDNTVYFKTVCPFIFPDIYDPKVYRGAQNKAFISNNELDIAGSDDPFPRGMMFPYKYSSDINLESETATYIGYINTTHRSSTNIRQDIDSVNFIPEYINWVKNNVDPRYYSVYEYRVPRSRFSHDRLDGVKSESLKQVVFSDKAVKEDGSTALPGDLYRENNTQVYANSEYKYDFTKVTMLKIEFSWYGAVGALFLAYVPAENGEARWVRVHHLRASNQLKIASLGNATLPITYNVFGGGSDKALGDSSDDIQQGYESTSHNIVKYGASYYIDGGDRGTVRLYSHNNDDAIESIGKKWIAVANTTTWDNSDENLSIDISSGLQGANTSVDPTFFMNARVKTENRIDNNIRVVWADADKIYLSSRPKGWTSTPTSNTITIIPDRANSVFGLETKENIVSQVSRNSVRNRVQVYPTKLSTSNLGNNTVRLRLKKSPIFQSNIIPSGTISLSSVYEVTSNNEPLSVTESSSPYIENGEEIYGWFKSRIDSPTIGNIVTVFGKLYKEVGQYYFSLQETVSGTVFLMDDVFLPEKRFDASGKILTGVTKSLSEKEGLSSISIADEEQVPIPETGINITTLYLQEGTEQFDLQSYFDYNKEYLSFPLTNRADTLYFVVDSDTDSEAIGSSNNDLISLGVTWEEQ